MNKHNQINMLYNAIEIAKLTGKTARANKYQLEIDERQQDLERDFKRKHTNEYEGY